MQTSKRLLRYQKPNRKHFLVTHLTRSPFSESYANCWIWQIFSKVDYFSNLEKRNGFVFSQCNLPKAWPGGCSQRTNTFLARSWEFDFSMLPKLGKVVSRKFPFLLFFSFSEVSAFRSSHFYEFPFLREKLAVQKTFRFPFLRIPICARAHCTQEVTSVSYWYQLF